MIMDFIIKNVLIVQVMSKLFCDDLFQHCVIPKILGYIKPHKNLMFDNKTQK